MSNFWMFLQQTAAASLTVLFLLVLQRLFRDKLSPRWQYTVWLVLLVRLLFPAGPAAGSILNVSGPLDALRLRVELSLGSAFSSPWRVQLPVIGLPLLPAGAPRSVTDGLFVVYLLGAAGCGVWLLAGWWGLCRTVKQSTPLTGERLEGVENTARRYDLKLPKHIVETYQVHTPFLMGVLRPTLVLPADWQVEETVVLHELIHLKNRDVAFGWLTALFRCVHWCNPFLWWVFDRIDAQREERCDQQVLERLEGEQRRDYGRVLLSMADDAHLRFPGSTAMANGARRVKRRIQAIARFKRYPAGMGLVSVCMSLILLPNLVLGYPIAAAAADSELPFGTLNSYQSILAYAQSHRCTTAAGALDAYAKGLRGEAYDFKLSLLCFALAAPEEEMPAVLDRWQSNRDACAAQPDLHYEQMKEIYTIGPIIRGFLSDGEGGYYTQMYFFRSVEKSSDLVYQRHTLHVTRDNAGHWSVIPLSQAQGRAKHSREEGELSSDAVLYNLVSGEYRLDEPPMVCWKTEVDGVEVELWPECVAALSSVFYEWGTNAWHPTTQGMNASLPQPGGGLSSAIGTAVVHVNNTTGADAVLSLHATQNWTSEYRKSGNWAEPGSDEGTGMAFGSFVGANAGYAGGNLSFRDVTVAPGARVIDFGGGGIYGSTTPDSCLLPDSYTGTLTVNGVTVDLETMERKVELG